ncbi:MAG: prepilin peptidase [Deltaproteobacteria bacterium]|nr:prepilin peptidase [Deltaproteobacteria bacterium]MBW2360370.1 prepilin peptidase [Deltaproteobacteria bacterium]
MVSFELLPTAWLSGAAGVLGLVIGSFLNVVIHRVPRGESVVRPRSHCPVCGYQLSAWQNLPLLSFALLRGRCGGCSAPISWRYPAIELLTGLLFAAVAWRIGATPSLPLLLAFAAALVAAGAIDFDHRIIPDEISLGGLVVALFGMPLTAWLAGSVWLDALSSSAAGALLGGGLLWLVGFVHARICVALGREFEHWPGEGEELPRPGSLDYWTWFPGIGFGDVKLLAMIGAVLGPLGVLATILASSIAGVLVGLVSIAITRSTSTPFGFGPAIAAGALFVLLVPVRLV